MDKFTTTVIVALLSLAVTKTEAAEFYGGSCNNETTTCTSSNILDPLRCIDKVCGCEDNLFRHIELDRCVAPHNQSCTIKSSEGKPITTCTEFAQCWPPSNAVLETKNGTCYCDPDATFDSVSGLCKLKHGSTKCKKETDCDTKSLLTCLDGKCACLDEENQHYDGSACVTLAGGSCKAIEPFPAANCGKNMKCHDVTKICECDEENGFISNPDRTCGKIFNATCDSDSDCQSQLVCAESDNSKKCVCKLGHEYHNATSKCLTLAGHTCNVTDESSQCTAHASCVNDKCTCDDGYQTGKENTTSEGKCVGKYDSQCSEDTLCSSEDFLQCTDQNVCKCMPNYDRDDSTSTCRGLIEQNCNTDSQCVGNSVCASDRKCACKEGQQPADDKRSCLVSFGSPCDSVTLCNTDKFLTCINSTCNCQNLDQMIAINGECRGKAEKPCRQGNKDIRCVDNATCMQETPPTCRCNRGFVDNPEGRCVEGNSSGSFTTSNAIYLLSMVSFLVIRQM